MKIKILIFFIILFIISLLIFLLSKSREELKISNFDISGTYICSSDYHSDEFSVIYSDTIPSVSFYDNGICEFIVNYFEGTCIIIGNYTVEGNYVKVSLDFRGTIFEINEDPYTGEKYMDDEYIFTIINNNKLIIDRAYYTVEAEDPFVKTEFPREQTGLPRIDISGTYIYSPRDYGSAEFFAKYPDAIPSISFYDERVCKLLVNYFEGEYIIVTGNYNIEGSFIKVSLDFRDTIFEINEDSYIGEKYMDDEYRFVIIANNDIRIDKGFYAVEPGAPFIKTEH